MNSPGSTYLHKMPTTAKYTAYGQVSFLEKVGAIASTMLYLRESRPPVASFTNFIHNDVNSYSARLDIHHVFIL